MDNVKINFAQICDYSFIVDGGKVSLIGIFTKIIAKKFPAIHPKFSIVVSLNVNNLTGKHKETWKLCDSDGNNIGSEVSFDFDITSSTQEVNFMSDVINTKFERPGKYFVKIFLDGQEIDLISFDVINV